MNTGPPEQIYLQCHEDDGSLRDSIRDDVTWCVDQINENDAAYILATPELASLLERLADYARRAAKAAKGSPDDVDEAYNDEEISRALAARIREIPEV